MIILYPLQAFADLVIALEWKSYLILYEDNDGLIRLQDVLKMSPKRSDVKIKVRQLQPGPGGDYR